MMTNCFSPFATGPATLAVRPHPGADLHVHTTHSDGAFSPSEVVIAAASVGLAALAITDHDTVSALSVAQPEASRLGLELIPGVELTCELAGREIHLLGHFIRIHDARMLEAMKWLRAGRSDRLEAMAAKLASQGMVVDLEALRRSFPRAALGRRHLAEYLARTGQVASVRRAFAHFLGDGCAACVAKPRLDAARGIELIRGAGGAAGLAHPPYDLQLETLRKLAKTGLSAIEVAGPGVKRSLGRRFRDWALDLELVPIAGSDFHTADRAGRWVGAITTPLPVLERLRNACV
jgi:predicted metal-dependent phosphoesterase TrpH